MVDWRAKPCKEYEGRRTKLGICGLKYVKNRKESRAMHAEHRREVAQP